MANWCRIVALTMLLGVMVGCSGGCSGGALANNKVNSPAKPVVTQKTAAIPVEAQMPTRGPLSEFFETTTRVEAERSVQVTAEGVGKCIKIVVDEGDIVTKGDALAELDTSELNTQINAATTQLHKAKADFERAKQGIADGIMPKVDYDNAKFAYEQQQSNVDQLNVQLGNMTVRAPLTGIVTKKLAQAGQIITSGAPCFEIIDPQSYVLNINAPEKGYLPRIKVGQKAAVKLDSLDEEITAKVRRINPAVDEATGTVKVTLDFDKSALPKLRDNAFARVNVILATHNDALMVPKNAVVEENTRKYVYVVQRQSPDADTAKPAETPANAQVLVADRREIKTGLEDSANVEVLEGIADNNMVVTVGQQTLKSGAEVKLTTVQEELLAKSDLSADDALKAAKEEHEKDKTQSSAP